MGTTMRMQQCSITSHSLIFLLSRMSDYMETKAKGIRLKQSKGSSTQIHSATTADQHMLSVPHNHSSRCNPGDSLNL